MAGRRGTVPWNKLTAEQHVVRGTFRRDRHGGRTARTVPVAEPIPPEVIEGLGERGKAFVEATWAHWGGWTPPDCVKLRLAGQLITDLDQRCADPRFERETQRLLLTALAALNLRD